MPSSRCLLLIALALGMYSQSSAWCTEEDKGKDCFINIRSAAPPQKQRGINFLDGKDSVKAAIGKLSRFEIESLPLLSTAPSHVDRSFQP